MKTVRAVSAQNPVENLEGLKTPVSLERFEMPVNLGRLETPVSLDRFKIPKNLEICEKGNLKDKPENCDSFVLNRVSLLRGKRC